MKTVTCPTCEGTGEVRHPLWGSPNCPEPAIPCRRCDGRGSVPESSVDEDDAEDWDKDDGDWTPDDALDREEARYTHIAE